MEYLICYYCPYEYCMRSKRECERYRTVKNILIGEIMVELEKLHKDYTEAEEEMEEDE